MECKASPFWPHLQNYLDNQVFSLFDLFFAKKLLPPHPQWEPCAFFLCYLMAISRKGHLCLGKEKGYLTPSLEGGEIDPFLKEKVAEGIQKLPDTLYQKVDPSLFFPKKPICQYQNLFYLQKSWVYENQLHYHLQRLLSSPFSSVSSLDLEATPLFPKQKQAIYTALTSPVTFILGGPGTGKTFTAMHFLQQYLPIFGSSSPKIGIAAPTGKAAHHLKQVFAKHISFPLSTYTLHRLLEITPQKKFSFEEPPLPYDLLLMDEASMIEAKLMAYLFSRMKTGAKLVLLGDPHQLPPVEAGALFRDLTQTRKDLCISLDKAARFESRELHDFSEAVLKSQKTKLVSLLGTPNLPYFSWSFASFPKEFYAYVNPFYNAYSKEPLLPEALLQKQQSFCILSPLRKGKWGVDRINATLKAHFFSQVPLGYFGYFPILITQNDPAKHLYNGMTGVFLYRKTSSSFPLSGEAFFLGEEKIHKFSSWSLPAFEGAYAVSVHKSQGSEYDTVFLIIPPDMKAAGKEVFYTAATRAKKKLSIWGDKNQMLSLIDFSLERTSGMEQRYKA